ncbi:MAG: CBS domain-containing protein [Propionibacterium sp.]|nr:CBS domain-containing protein [Propionibacterium sp.]
MLVKQKMTANPFTTTPGASLPDAEATMARHKVRHLPVIDGDRVVGVISKNDIAAALPSKATTLSAQEATYLIARMTVSQVMSKPALTISPDALLEEAAILMRDRKIEMLPVLEDGRLAAVITESDLLDSFIDLLGFRDHGTRLTVEARDEPGVLAQMTGIMARHHANIKHLAVHRGKLDYSVVVIGVNTLNTDAIEADLEAEGMRVIGTLVNRD